MLQSERRCLVPAAQKSMREWSALRPEYRKERGTIPPHSTHQMSGALDKTSACRGLSSVLMRKVCNPDPGTFES